MSVTSANKDHRYRELAWLLIAIATVMQLARTVGMTAAQHGELPFLSANDRSRWCAIAALCEDGKWEIDRVIEILDSKGKSRIWNTIDMVRHRGPDGKEHYYSSKPPLLTAMYAAICKPLTILLGKKLTEDPFLIGRTLIVIVNVVPLCLWWLWLERWLRKHVDSEWVRWIVLHMALWGTFLTTFSATLNNHLHGALFFTMSLAFLWQIMASERAGSPSSWWTWFACGWSAALTVACELPALAWAAAIGVLLLLIDWKKLFIAYGLSTASIAAVFLATNYWAHQDFRPPYSHRGVGSVIATIPKTPDSESPSVQQVIETANQHGYSMTAETKVIPARLESHQQFIDESIGQRVAITSLRDVWEVRHWDDWYDYPKSYWMPGSKKGVDRGEKNPVAYFFHFMVGHHGIFSLTPFWLLSILGAISWFYKRPITSTTGLAKLRAIAMSDAAIAMALCAVSVTCFAFYAMRPLEDRNYAGVCSGFRWVFWLTPGWLWLSVPAVIAAESTSWKRRAVGLLLLGSVFSATVPWPNPWSHPWPYRIAIWLYPEPEVK